jgi:hypothetical protein
MKAKLLHGTHRTFTQLAVVPSSTGNLGILAKVELCKLFLNWSTAPRITAIQQGPRFFGYLHITNDSGSLGATRPVYHATTTLNQGHDLNFTPICRYP